jgi:hypothetical protein
MNGHHVKTNALGKEGAVFDRAGGAASHKIVDCGAENITTVCQELRAAGVGLRAADGRTQLDTLRRALEYRGARGLNSYEGMAAGYMRMATRIKELKEAWDIHALKEDVVGPDGLVHRGVARYVLLGRRQDLNKAAPAQGGLEGCA